MKEIALPSGRTIACRSSDNSDEIVFRDPAGGVLLEVTLTPAGPRLHFQAAEVRMECEGAFQVRCRDFEVQAAGDARIVANDDVKLIGERVRLNC